MSPPTAPTGTNDAANRSPNPVSSSSSTAPNHTTSGAQLISKPSTTSAPPAWSSQTLSSAPYNGPSVGLTQFSATTAEILSRIRANPGNTAGTPAFEAKRAEVLQSYVTSDKLPTPPPIVNPGRRGRGGKASTPSQLKTEVGGSPANGNTPTSARGSGRGRGRGRGRGGGGRGGKRKRSESLDDSENDSDISSSYTPLPTRTKSGRNVNKPIAFVPTLPEPTPAVKRRRSVKTILAAQCKTCHRGTDPGNNRIVFCDLCNTAYHQYCHDPPIDNDVVTVLEKEWLCGPCDRSKQNVIEGTEGLVAGDGLSIDDKRAYLSTLPSTRLIALLLHALVRHPELPIFPSNVADLILTHKPTVSSTNPKPVPTPAASSSNTAEPRPPNPPKAPSPLPNPLSTTATPRSLNPPTDSPDVDPAEAQLLGEITRSHAVATTQQHSSSKSASASAFTSAPAPSPKPTFREPPQPRGSNIDAEDDEFDDGYDTDPPAHYPKPGNGVARTLRPETEEGEAMWLVDDNLDVFSHGWREGR